MNKPNLSKVIKNTKLAANRHKPEILMFIGITGMIGAAVFAVKETPKALMLIENRKNELDQEKLTPIETIKTAWACYIPAVIISGLSIVCLLESNFENVRRNAAIMTAYTLSESALKRYREQVVETIGEKKEQNVRDAVAKNRLERNPVSSQEVIITEKGNTLCYDVINDRYFKSDIDRIKRAATELSYNMLSDTYVSLNDFYYAIGLKTTKRGDDLGWNVIDGPIDLNFSAQLADDGTPCLVIDYSIAPRYDFQKR